MTRYFDIDREQILTRSDILASFEEFGADGETFEEYMNACMEENNGSLRAIDESVFWYMHTCDDGIVRIESTEMCDEFGSDAIRVYMIGETSFGFRFVTEDGAIYEADADDLQVIDWDNWE